MGIEHCQKLKMPIISDVRGNLTFIEGKNHIPFDIERVYYLFDVPTGAERGGHAHRELVQLLIAMSGSFDVELDDGVSKKTVTLNKPYEGLLIQTHVWRELKNFSSGAVCLVLASMKYTEDDYFRDYDEFLKFVRSK